VTGSRIGGMNSNLSLLVDWRDLPIALIRKSVRERDRTRFLHLPHVIEVLSPSTVASFAVPSVAGLFEGADNLFDLIDGPSSDAFIETAMALWVLVLSRYDRLICVGRGTIVYIFTQTSA